ncbi:hypothetical protein SD70_23395 [Gordoniibacillus kamchatkensis]|uniref:DUF2269 family protein n=1 Tax=Gordoniibacillus kamchatkensis TaxID=1590651 RepID=A0ABR5ADJ1_9BACL|nr:DUF2269 family protein [Paenibacillus sp. VKM B-2647]KIL38903.1 hypothetical protein SD70_23395 [Paenibacillus sp. VKM B-2647]
MKWLILLHVLSSIIGVGPTFFGHVLLRRKQSLHDLRASLRIGKRLEAFPKIGGSIAVLSGLILIWVGNYGSFAQLWLYGSLILYVLIQVIVIGIITPNQKKLAGWVFDPANERAQEIPPQQRSLLGKVSSLYYCASTLGVLLFIFMIMKP